MIETAIAPPPLPVLEDIQKQWPELTLKVSQMEAEQAALEKENKTLRALLERVIEHRQKSHAELILILTTLVGKLPLNDVGIVVARLVEHSNNTAQYLAALIKGTVEAQLPEPELLKHLEQSKRDLAAALKTAIDELIALQTPLEAEMLQSLIAKPDLFSSPQFARANRCFVKGLLPRERIVREFGDEALVLFNDVTTDPKLNPRPRPEEIALSFKSDFESLLQQNPALVANKRQDLIALYQKVQASKAPTEQARVQKTAFLRMSFLIELLNYYENQSTVAPDSVFAQRLPGLIEQLVLPGAQDSLDEKRLLPAEALLAFITNSEHRLMVVNNLGKAGGASRTLRFVLRLRLDKIPDNDPEQLFPELIKHLVPPQKPPDAASLAAILTLLSSEMQIRVIQNLFDTDRITKDKAEELGKATAAALNLKLPEKPRGQTVDPAQLSSQRVWSRIRELIASRSDAATVAAAIRDRLNAKYDSDEIRQSWLTLIEADSISFIRTFCQVPYRANGSTDPIARAVIETYVTRLTHEKYTSTYQKVVNSLKTMFTAKPDNPTLLNFTALVRWVNPEAASKLCADIGMPAAAH
jgi:hypothetical protein